MSGRVLKPGRAERLPSRAIESRLPTPKSGRVVWKPGRGLARKVGESLRKLRSVRTFPELRGAEKLPELRGAV